MKLPENPHENVAGGEFTKIVMAKGIGYFEGQQATLKAVVEWLEEQLLEKAFQKGDRYYLVSQIKVDELKKLIV